MCQYQICSSSTSIKTIRNWSDFVLDIRHFVKYLIINETMILFSWIPSRTGKSNNEWANKLPKQEENAKRKSRQHIGISIICIINVSNTKANVRLNEYSKTKTIKQYKQVP